MKKKLFMFNAPTVHNMRETLNLEMARYPYLCFRKRVLRELIKKIEYVPLWLVVSSMFLTKRRVLNGWRPSMEERKINSLKICHLYENNTIIDCHKIIKFVSSLSNPTTSLNFPIKPRVKACDIRGSNSTGFTSETKPDGITRQWLSALELQSRGRWTDISRC